MIAGNRKERVHDVLVADIRRQINEGLLQPGHYLLAERALASKYGISARAVRLGLTCLETEGMIGRHQGRGTVVLEQLRNTQTALNNVAVIYQGRINDSVTAEEFDNLQQAFQREGYGTTLYVADYSPQKEVEIVDQLVAAKIPGLVLFSAHAPDSADHLRRALHAGMKIVSYHDFPGVDCNFVGIDIQSVVVEITEHLIRLGCPELLHIRSELDRTDHTVCEDTILAVARRCDVPTMVLRMPNSEAPSDRIERIQRQLSARRDSIRRPLGAIVWRDLAAHATIDAVQAMGWTVPDDVKVVGFGNEPPHDQIPRMPLTTVAFPRREIARLAATLLLGQMKNTDRPSQHIRLPARMVIRESCGNYPRATGSQSTTKLEQWEEGKGGSRKIHV